MATRLTLLCAGATAGSRVSALPSPDEPLDEGGLGKARAFRLRGPRPALVLASPARAAIETAQALGLQAEAEPRVADRDFGMWSGRSLADIDSDDPEALKKWLADPLAAVPGGETMAQVGARIATLVDRVADESRSVLIVSHAAPIRAALAHALMLPLASTSQIDIAPLSTLVLSHHGQWRLQALAPAGR